MKDPVRESTADREAYNLSFIRSDEGLKQILDELEELYEWSSVRNPYFSPEWIKCWWKKVKKGTKPMVVIVRDEKKKLDGFWPFVERPGILWSKGLWPMIYDEANYFEPIAMKEVVPFLIEGLKSKLKEFQFFWLPLIRDPFWKKYFQTELLSSKFLYLARIPRKTSIMESEPCDFHDFWLKKMGAKSRKSLRYDKKNLREKGDVEIQIASDEKEVRSLLPASCLVEVNSWKSEQVTGLYSIRGKRAFFFDLLPMLAKKGRVRVSMIRVDDEPIAWEVDLLDKKFMGVHNLSYDQRWKKFSPGRQLMEKNLENAWNEGRCIDFLPGNLNYKEKVATKIEPVHELHFFKKSIRGLLAKRLILWNRKIRKKIILSGKPTKASESLRKSLEMVD